MMHTDFQQNPSHDRTHRRTPPPEPRNPAVHQFGARPPAHRILSAQRRQTFGAGDALAFVPAPLHAQVDPHRRGRTDRRRTRPRAQSGADLSRTHLPQRGGLADPQLAAEDILPRGRGLPARLSGNRRAVLARPLIARPHVPGVAGRLAGGLQRRDFHRVHGTTRARPHGARRQDLPQGNARVQSGHRRSHRRARFPQ